MSQKTKREPKIPIDEWVLSDVILGQEDKIERPSHSYFKESWLAFKKNRIAIGATIIVILVGVMAIFGPIFSPYRYDEQELDFTNLSNKLQLYKVSEDLIVSPSKDLRLFRTDTRGKLLEQIEVYENDFSNRRKIFRYQEEVLILDFSAKDLVMINNTKVINMWKETWNKKYLLGTDKLGRDLHVRLMYGARISLAVAFIATSVNMVIGVLYGGIAGYFGGWIDNLMIRIIDVLSAVPMMLYIILLMVAIGPGLKTIIIAMGVVFWIGTARLVRGEILSLKSKEYVMAAKVIGVNDFKILIRHLLPNAIGPIVVSVTFMIPDAIFTEAFLSFIGLGIPAPQASWGTLCESALEGLQTYPYQLFYPAVAISVTILALNLMGDGLRDALDPRLRE
jgi:oligopeptide transport system permease protein